MGEKSVGPIIKQQTHQGCYTYPLCRILPEPTPVWCEQVAFFFRGFLIRSRLMGKSEKPLALYLISLCKSTELIPMHQIFFPFYGSLSILMLHLFCCFIAIFSLGCYFDIHFKESSATSLQQPQQLYQTLLLSKAYVKSNMNLSLFHQCHK